jgi:hypothetical protein
VPVATQLSQLNSPPPPITFTLDVTAALIGSGTSIAVDWIAPGADPATAGVALNATTDPATTLLELPALSATTPPGATGSGATGSAGTSGELPATGQAESSQRIAGIALGFVALGLILMRTARRRVCPTR